MNGQAQALLRHFTARLGTIENVEYSDTPWHSATFNGVRHNLSFTVDLAADITAFANAIGEADLPIPGGFVADALVTAIDGRRISMEVLTIDAA